MSRLLQILEHKRTEVDAAQARVSHRDVRAQIADLPPTRGFLSAIQNDPRPCALIAEVKKASPSQGSIREDFDPAELAATYRDAGATCLSVLTDERFFQGHNDYLARAREVSGLPCLRKDFTIDAYQIAESRVLGADCILLIVAALSPAQVQEYMGEAAEYGLDVLVEAHDADEAMLAAELGAELIGVNNRDLRTFETDLGVTERVLPMLSGRATLVSESALESREDVRRAEASGARAVLIGTAFCRRPDVGVAVKEIMGW